MNKILLTLLSLLAAFAATGQNIPPFEAIRMHREWMKANTPDPATLDDQELMRRSAEIISCRLSEPEAERILDAAAKKVPEVAEYLNWSYLLDCDTLQQRLRNAYRGIADYLDRSNPGCYEARSIRAALYDTESQYRNVLPEFQELINRQQKIADKSRDKREKALLLRMKLDFFGARHTIERTDDPRRYPEIWDLERQVLELYPIESTDTVEERRDLYFALGALKNIPNSQSKVAMMLDVDNPCIDNGTLYEYVGPAKDYTCNTGFYLDKAIELSCALYGPTHPATMATEYQWRSFRLSNFPLDQQLLDEIRWLNNYYSSYYPLRVAEPAFARMLLANAEFLATRDSGLSFKDKADLLNTYKLAYGDRSMGRLGAVGRFATFDLFGSSDQEAALGAVNAYFHECDLAFPDDPMLALGNKFSLASLIYMINSTEGRNYIDSLADEYISLHDGSLASAEVGECLLNYYQNTALDFDAALHVIDAYSDDTRSLYGYPSAPYFSVEMKRFQCAVSGDKTEDLKNLDRLLSDAQKGNYKAKRYIVLVLLNEKALYLLGSEKWKEAYGVLRQIADEDKSNGAYVVRARAANCLVNMGGKANLDKAAKEIEFLVKAIEKEDKNSVSPTLTDQIGQYFWSTGDKAKAIEYWQTALDAHNWQTQSAMDDVYFSLARQLEAAYEATGDVNALSRLASGERADLLNAAITVPTFSLGYYMLDGFYRAMRQQDFGGMQFYIGGLNNVVNSLSFSSSTSDAVKYSLGIDTLHAYLDILDFLKNLLNSMQNDSASAGGVFANVVNQYEDSFSQMLQQASGMKDILDELEETFPVYNPSYKSVTSYHTLLATRAQYAELVEKDFDTAANYVIKTIGLTSDPVVRSSGYFKVADLKRQKGDSVAADANMVKAIEMIEADPIHFNNQAQMQALAYRFNKHLQSNDIAEAGRYAREIYARNRRMLDGNFQLMSTVDQDKVFNTYGDPAWALANLLEKAPEQYAGEVYDAIVYRTGMKLRSGRETRLLVERSANPDVRLVADSIATLQAKIKQVNVSPENFMSQAATEDYNRLADLNFKVQRLEMELLDLIASERTEEMSDVKWQQIRDALRPGEAAVEFLFSNSKVMALILRPGATAPIAVELTPWEDLSSALSGLKAKNSATLAQRLYDDRSIDLYAMLWQPLEAQLDGVKTVYFNAPGALHSISFNALRDPSGEYLIDRYDLRQLTTTAQLTFPADEQAPSNAFIIGEVLFDPAQASLVGHVPEKSGERAIDNEYSLDDFTIVDLDGNTRGASRPYFSYLPFTGVEISDIKRAFGSRPVTLSKLGDATETQFRELCSDGAPEVLHLATHGFFLPDEASAMRVPFMKRYSSHVGSPMQRSGVALANAEAAWRGADLPEESDGILTAGEVANLNLKGTRLVAISACESALGGYDFEGVHGLTRGFKQAGARSLLVSLWSVNDSSTALFMSEFYRHWLAGSDRHAAYRAAVAAVREKYPSPFYWAPFILLD